ncbi:purine and uridine phosphorylase [Ceratobasidium sp. AG-I]|nr:purine and uridine phosphorylase [Ceratobasidium sp. AG-I]
MWLQIALLGALIAPSVLVPGLESPGLRSLTRRGDAHLAARRYQTRLEPTPIRSSQVLAHCVPYYRLLSPLERILQLSSHQALKESLRSRLLEIIDRTQGARPASLFEGTAVVARAMIGYTFDTQIINAVVPLVEIALKALPESTTHPQLHTSRCVVCVEGFQFSTRAESHMYRAWGGNVINMSVLPEAKLAREAELSYALIVTATDYDCWRVSEAPVTVAEVFRTLQENADRSRKFTTAILEELNDLVVRGEALTSAECGMRYSLVTQKWPEEDGAKLAYTLPKYFEKKSAILSSAVPARANIAALKSLGVKVAVVFSTVGSFREEIRSGDLIVPGQITDCTNCMRPGSFFEGTAIVAHVMFGDPFDIQPTKALVLWLKPPSNDSPNQPHLFLSTDWSCMRSYALIAAVTDCDFNADQLRKELNELATRKDVFTRTEGGMECPMNVREWPDADKGKLAYALPRYFKKKSI